MKVAIVHYWLIKMRGGEKVLESLCEIFPDADIYTHVYNPDGISSKIKKHKVYTSFIAKLPRAVRFYQSYLPLMPFSLKWLDLSGYDLVISSESGPAKGVVVKPETRHICYCHTPMRYVWDMYDEYRQSAGFITRLFMSLFIKWLRKWDKGTADGVDEFIANSQFVQQRIKNIYNRESTVIYPPVSVEEFYISDNVDDYYLYAGELTQYKQPHLAIEAFNLSGRKLLVIGEGGMMAELRLLAKDNIVFLGRQTFEKLKFYFSHCKALIFPGVEDFGIVPVEVMASGRPVIAFRAGGALETVVENESGIFFDEQTPQSLNTAIDNFEEAVASFKPAEIREISRKFSKECFFSAFREKIIQGPGGGNQTHYKSLFGVSVTNEDVVRNSKNTGEYVE